MMSKRKPHHNLVGIKEKFASVDTLEVTTTALHGARRLGYDRSALVRIVQQLEQGDFVSSSTAHNPRNHRIWHDSYRAPFDGMQLYLKFAGETLIDVILVSFKESER